MDKREMTKVEVKGPWSKAGVWGAKGVSNATPSPTVACRTTSGLCLLSFVLCPLLLALAAPEPTALVGVVAQRFPWNGVVDVTCKVTAAPKGAPLVVSANGVEVVRVAATNGEQKVSFDASKVDALKDKKLKDVKITAKVAVVPPPA